MSVIGAPMRDYYERRAREYDDWWLGTGLFARRERPGWHEEVQRLIALLERLPPARTLDVACGTGFLTRHLPGAVTGLDQSPAMVEIAAGRGLEVAHGEAVPLPFEDGRFERLFTSHFYGHLVAEEAERFLTEARRVAGELMVVDAASRPDIEDDRWEERRLNDGSSHAVYKRRFRAGALAEELGGGEVLHVGDWFVAVRAGRAPERP